VTRSRRTRARAIGASAATFLVLVGLWTVPRWLVPLLSDGAPCLYAVETTVPAVALTIDDTPDPRTTVRILEVLAQNAAHATFFVIGEQIPGNEHVLRELVAGGHEVGNHNASDESSIRLSDSAFEASVRETGRTLWTYAPVQWWRPGSGWVDSAMAARVSRLGYRCALGSVYPYDPAIPSVTFASRYILSNTRPGAVIVLHDRGARGRRTARILERVLPALAARGVRVVTLTEMLRLSDAGAGTSR
jgi:peptidoglycan/xylan/chitin deacetylase (PgdA/CDA1 family)